VLHLPSCSSHFAVRSRHSYFAVQFTVDAKDIRAFSSELFELLVNEPASYMPLLELAAKEVVRGLTLNPPPLAEMADFQAQLINYDRFTDLRMLSASDVSKVCLLCFALLRLSSVRLVIPWFGVPLFSSLLSWFVFAVLSSTPPNPE
jgi:hypothetical protein